MMVNLILHGGGWGGGGGGKAPEQISKTRVFAANTATAMTFGDFAQSKLWETMVC